MQKHVLKIIEKTFRVNSIEPQAQPLKVLNSTSPLPWHGASSAVVCMFSMGRLKTSSLNSLGETE